MEYRCFDVRVSDAIARIELKRGDELNTMVPEFWRELPEIVRSIDEKAKARVIVITSTGRHFSAGMDLSVFTGREGAENTLERGRKGAQLRERILALQESFTAIERARMPVLVAIQGGCVGGAVDLVSACDCRYASEDAFFVVQEINLAMTADVGTFPRLCHLVPQGWVRELAYTGRRLAAREALSIGLVNAVLPTHEELVEHVMTMAREIAEKSPLAVYGSKTMINYARDHTVAEGLDYVATWQAGMYNPETDMREAMVAKREKRGPRFADLPPRRKELL
ncbi:MAG TPA: crotonase/enoyl-CoA hydratase family protein [Rhizomicrobium sp.]|jgi:enoyl-CoA hydratase